MDPGVRIDTAAYAECRIPPYYDPMIAKVITHGRDRAEAIDRMRRALEVSVVGGVKTTIPLHLRILSDPDFLAGRLSTRFLERLLGTAPARHAEPPAGPALPLRAHRPEARPVERSGAGASALRGPASRWCSSARRASPTRSSSREARAAARALEGRATLLIVNDRVDVALLAGASRSPPR